MDLREIGWESGDWIRLAQDRVLVVGSIKGGGEFLYQLYEC